RRHRDRDLREAGGRTVGRDAAVGVVLRGAHVAVGRTTRGELRAQVVATRIAEHLERAVAVHVPTEAEARRPLWRGLPHVGLAAAVVVGEAVVAQADGHQPAVAHLPVVLYVLGTLGRGQAAHREADVLGDVIGAGTVREAGQRRNAQGGRQGGARIGGVAVAPVIAWAGGDVALVVGAGTQVVDAAGDGMAAQRVGQADPQVAGLVVVGRVAHRGDGLGIGDRRPAVERRILVRVAADISEAGVVTHRLVVVHRGHLAVHGVQREAVGEVAGVLGRPHVAAQLGVVGEGLEALVGQVVVVVVVVRTRGQTLLGRAGQFQQVAVVDVP